VIVDVIFDYDVLSCNMNTEALPRVDISTSVRYIWISHLHSCVICMLLATHHDVASVQQTLWVDCKRYSVWRGTVVMQLMDEVDVSV